MKARHLLVSSALLVLPAIVWGSIDAARNFFRELEDGPPGAPGTYRPREYSIKNYDKQIIEGLLAILKSEQHIPLWKDAFWHLGIIASVDDEVKYREELYEAVEKLERTEILEGIERIHLLGFGYSAISSFGHLETIEFIERRVFGEAFEGAMPTAIQSTSIGVDWEVTGASAALLSVGVLGEEIAMNYLDDIRESGVFATDPVLRRTLESHRYLEESRKMGHEIDLATYASRGLSGSTSNSTQPASASGSVGTEASGDTKTASGGEKGASAGRQIGSEGEHLVGGEVAERSLSPWWWAAGVLACVSLIAALARFRN